MEDADPEDAVEQDEQGDGESGRPPLRMPQVLCDEESWQEKPEEQEERK